MDSISEEIKQLTKHFYNRIAASYDKDWSGIYANTRAIGISQIREHYTGRTVACALDLAVGTGNSFVDLDNHLLIGRRTGNDISSAMLRQAANKVQGPIELICDDARNILHHVPASSQDLVLCHYLFSYLDIDQVLKTVAQLLKPGGLISMATTTKKNLLELSTGRFRLTGKLFGVGKHLGRVATPNDHKACLNILATHNFKVLQHNNYRQTVVFNSFDDVTAWGVDSGWAAQYFDSGFALKASLARAIFAGAAVVMHPLYPITAQSDISIVLAEKPGPMVAS